jgi:hypothetical protein
MEARCEGTKAIGEREMWQTEEREGVGDIFGVDTCQSGIGH